MKIYLLFQEPGVGIEQFSDYFQMFQVNELIIEEVQLVETSTASNDLSAATSQQQQTP